MKSRLFRMLFTGIPILLLTSLLNAQTLENVIVEEYADPSGASVDGVTYRVFIDMGPGDKLLTVYGFDDEDPATGNALSIETSTGFYNDAFGSTFGENINSALFGVPNFEGSAVDTWLSFGGSAIGQLGVPKALDPDDPGSSSLVPFLADAPDGIAPGTNGGQDGYTAGSTLTSVSTIGELNTDGAENDGASSIGTMDGAFFNLGGVDGVGDENVVCIGQFTTDGEFSFQINVQIQSADGVEVNYVHSNATQPDGSEAVVFAGLNFPLPPVMGCTNEEACNYNPESEVDDDSCILNGDMCDANGEEGVIENCECVPVFVEVPGCINPDACNFDELANTDDGSCILNGDMCDANGEEGVIEDCECVPVFVEVPGCINPDACNFDELANTDDGSCVLNGDMCDANGEEGVIEDCECVPVFVEIPGCINPDACNFDELANTDDGSCVLNGDMCDANGEEGVIEDCECVPVFVEIPGCINPDACNFDELANTDDGSCVLNGDMCDADGEEGVIEDCECVPVFVEVPGCINPDACNFDEMANTDDGSCILNGDACELSDGSSGIIEDCECVEQVIEGCTDPTAENYNPEATEDDGSCEYEEVAACDGETGGFEGLIVEEYYQDGPMEGYKTYRMFLDLAPGYKLLAVYGYDDADEATGNDLGFSTSTSFYNDDFGQAFGETINSGLFESFPGSALDTWLSFGGAAAGQMGIQKANDEDGSNLVPFLTNVPSDGISPSTNDGYTEGEPEMTSELGMNLDGVSNGGANFVGSEDGSFFVLGGVNGADENNTVLIGQFTTDGNFGYRLNIQVQSPDGENELYVHTNAVQPDGTVGRVCPELISEPCSAEGGMIAYADGSDEASICLGEGEELDVVVEGAGGGDEIAFAWVITDPDLNILALPEAPPFNFDGAGEGACLIWYLAFDPENSNVFEVIESDEPNAGNLEGCFDLSNPITVIRENCDDDCQNFEYYYADILEDGTTDIYEVELVGSEAVLELKGTSDIEVHIALNEENGLIYAVSKLDGSFRTFDPETGVFGPVEMLDTEVSEIVGAAFNADGKLLILSQSENAIYSVTLGANTVSVFDSYSPVLGGDIDFGEDGALYLATREGFGTFYVAIPDEIMPDMLVGDAPQLVTGIADINGEGALLFSHRDAFTFEVRGYDGTEGTPYDVVLEGEPFMTFNGDLASGCADNRQPNEPCEQVIYYTNQVPGGGSYTLYSTTLNGDGTATNLALLEGVAGHIGVTPDGSIVYIVGGGSLDVFDTEMGMITNTVNIVNESGASIGSFPACVVTEDGTLYVAGNGNRVYTVDPGTGIATLVTDAYNVNGGDLIEAPTGPDGAGEVWLITRNNGTFTRISDGTSFAVPGVSINGAAVLENGNVLVADGDGDGEDALIEVDLSDLSIAAAYDVEFDVQNGDLAATCVTPSEDDDDDETAMVEETGVNNTLTSFPNPTNGPSVAIFSTGVTERATLEVYDMNGRLVQELFNGVAESDVEYRLDFDGLALPNGVYMYRLTTDSETIVEKFMIAK